MGVNCINGQLNKVHIAVSNYVCSIFDSKKTNFSIFQKNTLYPQPLLKINKQKKKTPRHDPWETDQSSDSRKQFECSFFLFFTFFVFLFFDFLFFFLFKFLFQFFSISFSSSFCFFSYYVFLFFRLHLETSYRRWTPGRKNDVKTKRKKLSYLFEF